MIQNGNVHLNDLSVFSGLPVLEENENKAGSHMHGGARTAAIGIAVLLLAVFAVTDGLGLEDLVFASCLALVGLGFSLFISKK